MSKEKKPQQVRITNKRASFDYEFLEEYDAGIVLVGTEIKSIRAGVRLEQPRAAARPQAAAHPA